jgi:hypothetical protein
MTALLPPLQLPSQLLFAVLFCGGVSRALIVAFPGIQEHYGTPAFPRLEILCFCHVIVRASGAHFSGARES